MTFLATNTLNFAMIAGGTAFGYGVPVALMLRSFVTALPSEFATALLTAGDGVHATANSASARSAWPRSSC